MGNSSSHSHENVDYWASTEALNVVEVEAFTFLWTVKNFSAFQTTKELRSPYFKAGPRSNHIWQLKISPRHKVVDKEYLSTFLVLASHGNADKVATDGTSRKLKVKTRFKICLLDSEGRTFKETGASTMLGREFDRENNCWGYYRVMPTDELLSPFRRLLDGDTLRILCSIWIDGEPKHITGLGGIANAKPPEEVRLRHLENLSEDMRAAFRSQRSPDVTLQCATGKSLSAHKAVLAARSRVFKAMFSYDMSESTMNHVEIPDFEKCVVASMLEYIYSGRTPVVRNNAPDLLRIAEKYELTDLKEDCEIAMAASLVCENVADVLVLAHFHNAAKLKAAAMEFIKRNKEKLMKTNEFAQVVKLHGAVFFDIFV